MVSVRTILTVIGVAFTAYLAARGLWWTGDVTSPALIIAAILLYAATTWLWIFWGARTERQSSVAPGVPIWAGVLALAVALAVPNALMVATPPSAHYEPYVTWAIGGIGALMTIIMVRGRWIFAWTGMVLMGGSYMVWLGALEALVYGLIGSIVWVAVAQLALIFLMRASRDAQKLAELQQAASAWQAAHAGRAQERRMHVRRALAEAGPILSRTIVTGAELTAEERAAASLAEWRLRDELRAARLLDNGVRDAVDDLRRRGVNVMLFDEGGLDGLSDPALRAIRSELAEILRGATSPRLYVRTSPDEKVAVTVVGRAPAPAGTGDEDAVELWREIGHFLE
ncbi:hypothetical protein FHX48_001759 [Microbacterium halimionae]|uniref:Uncharacterized protein n=1 Tax=Microbacterium halimionae TaxID=1526413 RepID=A0A7W3PM45_9MICO|nr:hypothetical protein [Microbacterium halimionae]MBA8816686.1 hypothetical protein [Microbacterium halimionae]NII95127.1 hypothetical protein [Microbacterium halimionae]